MNNGHFNLSANDQETAEDAIARFLSSPKFANEWKFTLPFGHRMEEMRRINQGIRDKNRSAFKASRRRGYWRIELAE